MRATGPPRPWVRRCEKAMQSFLGPEGGAATLCVDARSTGCRPSLAEKLRVVFLARFAAAWSGACPALGGGSQRRGRSALPALRTRGSLDSSCWLRCGGFTLLKHPCSVR